MKPVLYALSMILLFISCKSNTKQDAKDTVALNKPATDQSQDLIRKFGPIIQGVWVKKDYIDKAIRSKSPIEAVDLAGGITIINLKTDRTQGDSIVISVAWDNHEGGDLILKYRPGKKRETIQLGDYDLGYTIKNGDTTLILYDYINDKRNEPITAFKKISGKQTHDIAEGVNYLINKGLISGKYKSTDSLGAQSDVVFTDNGKVSGLSDYKTYYVQFDLSNDPMSNLDEIDFDLGKKSTKSYSYKIEADTLTLYHTHTDADSTDLILGKRVYKLVKQK